MVNVFETTIGPALRRIYASIDYAANQALVEISHLALNAYSNIWGRSAFEKPAYLRGWERQSVAQHKFERFFDGFLRYQTDFQCVDAGQEYRREVMELPLDTLFIAQWCADGHRDGNAEVLALFDTLPAAIAFVDRYAQGDIAPRLLQGALSNG